MSRWCVFVVAALGLGCSKEDSSRSVSGATVDPIERATRTDAEPSLADRLAATDSFAAAVELAKPMMDDTTDEISPGALALALWGTRRMRLADVVLAKNADETKPALIHKDSDRERGKRLCVRGHIVQITKDDLGIFIGLLMMNDGDVVHYLACGDTGDLVERSRARFCGVAIGRYTYANAGGGTTHAIEMVGMFDLPSNRAE